MVRMRTLTNCPFARTALFALIVAVHGAAFGAAGAAFEPLPAGEAKQHRGRLGSILNGVVAAYERELQAASSGDPKALATGAAARDAAISAAGHAPMSQGASVAVTFRIDDASKIEALTRFLKENEGDPRNVGEDYVEAYVPVALLVEASQQPGVRRVQAIIPPQPKRGPVTSQGVAVHGADRWHALGVTGKGIKVGVIDGGFTGFRALMGSELPATVVARCYRSMGRYTSDIADCGIEGEAHGTAVAEALLDMAPAVSLYIADPETGGDLKNTVDWMADQGVQVINYSASGPWDGPGDGTSPYSESALNTVDTAIEKGVVWAAAAGNEGQSAWLGPFRDYDRDGWHQFNEREGRNCFVQENAQVQIQLRWQGQWDSGALLADLDLYLFDINGVLVGVSASDQGDQAYDTPTERISHEADVGESRCIAVYRDYSWPAPDPDWIQLIVLTSEDLRIPTIGGSIGNPAESANPGLLAVGAAPWNNTSVIGTYSSRGPTPDGRTKPDIVGVDQAHSAGNRTADDPSGAFPGTSQASPHVAGLAALVRQAYPEYRPRQVAAYLQANTSSRALFDPYYGHVSHPNNVWGYGLAGLPPIHGWYSKQVAQGAGSRSVPLSRYFSRADIRTIFEAASSNPALLAAAVRQGAVVLTPAQDREGRATITVQATFRDGSQETVLIVVTVRQGAGQVEDVLASQERLASWRLALYRNSTTTSSTTAFRGAFVE